MTPTCDSGISSSFEDPRRHAGFLPQYYPKVNGSNAPLDGLERNDRILIEFAAAYYHLNCAYAALLEVRRAAVSPQRKEAEKEALQAVERLLIARDSLEDHYAPFGVLAAPVVKEGFTTNIKIGFGNVDATGRRRSEAYTVTAFAPVPLPEGFQFETLPISIEGPGINPE